MVPPISVIITSYNRANYISKAIESVLDQDYDNIELIIIDNCSTDNSEEVISTYLSDSRVKLVKNPTNIGAVSSIIKAIELSKGDYITHVSSDDYLINNSFISECVDYINKYDDMVMVTAKNVFLDKLTKRIIIPDTHTTVFHKSNCVDGKTVFLENMNAIPMFMGACLMNREKFLRFKEQKAAPIYYDMQMVMQLQLLGNVGFIDKDSYVVLLHDTNLVGSNQPASVYIENFQHIEAPYQLALKLKSFENNVLNNWHNKMLFKYSYEIMDRYYKKDKEQFKIFSSFVKEQFPDIYIQIINKPKWVLISIFFKYPIIGTTLANIKSKLKKMLTQ
jgi:glycosyltransferase involved in cell wall biosynthesis